MTKDNTEYFIKPDTDEKVFYKFIEFQQFHDNTEDLTYLKVIGIGNDGSVTFHSAFEVKFVTVDELKVLKYIESNV
ncbi:hypothetical protein LAG90_15665 [Marinilongibacter aquaticus]|uniref:hypothetical protein n=1 Tax=Marinilongibacter aquaticus TaxID=2975157 RepID=UPI0021BDE0E2|nr:hypothetical protein [Marinilongibacter aquaticus]UBM58241.1 hypothetical protein LAG90_15665 [Marinilongibacter aquaticus]